MKKKVILKSIKRTFHNLQHKKIQSIDVLHATLCLQFSALNFIYVYSLDVLTSSHSACCVGRASVREEGVLVSSLNPVLEEGGGTTSNIYISAIRLDCKN